MNILALMRVKKQKNRRKYKIIIYILKRLVNTDPLIFFTYKNNIDKYER